MHKTGIEDYYALKDGKRLRFGYTSGSCAAAAAKAATRLLLWGGSEETVELRTPKGIVLNLEVLEPLRGPDWASCAVRKDSGDDPDVTDGILVYARVCWSAKPGLHLDGGVGVGRVTKPGLKQELGQAAINPVPRQMILDAVEEALEGNQEGRGLDILISIPAGVELAAKTFNPHLGIVGGISVLGTSGIVEPMSESALVESIRLELQQRKALGQKRLLVAPGNYGSDFIRRLCNLDEGQLVKCSNFIGQTIDMAAEEGFGQLFLIGHIGKLIKLSGGIMNTHSREADGRSELMAACALRAGAEAPLCRRILDCLTTDEMLRQLEEAGLLQQTMAVAGERIGYYLNNRAKGKLEIGALVFSPDYGILCSIGPAAEWLSEMEE